jgi:pyroglutamyl-peptidase
MPVTILVTGFGPFPGAPFNPTGPLVQRLARLRRPCLANVKIVPHIFPTSYVAVDRDLPKLLARHKPDALLMFGLAPRAKAIRIETRARNSVSLLPDAGGIALHRLTVAAGGPAALAMPAPVRGLLAAVRAAGVSVALSRDAGRYLCNYLCWRAAEAAGKPGGPRVAVFIHVPQVRRGSVPRGRVKKRHLEPADLARAGGAILPAIAGAARR